MLTLLILYVTVCLSAMEKDMSNYIIKVLFLTEKGFNLSSLHVEASHIRRLIYNEYLRRAKEIGDNLQTLFFNVTTNKREASEVVRKLRAIISNYDAVELYDADGTFVHVSHNTFETSFPCPVCKAECGTINIKDNLFQSCSYCKGSGFFTEDEYIKMIMEAAKKHGENSEPDHEVGDLQVMLRLAIRHLTYDGKTNFFKNNEVQSLINSEFVIDS